MNSKMRGSSYIGICLAFVLLVFFGGCKAGKVTTPEKFKGEKLSAGSGGGITGAETEYILLANGQVFKKETIGKRVNLTQMKPLTKNEAGEVFFQVKQMKIDELHIEIPGNMTSFLEHTINGQTNRLSWNERQDGVPPEVIGFYDHLMRILPQEKK